MPIILVNNHLVSENEPQFALQNSGLLSGEGLLETIRARNGKIEFLSDHLQRLRKGAKYFRIKLPALPEEKLIKILLQKNNLDREIARLRIMLTRCNTVVTVQKYLPLPSANYRQGVKLITARHPLNGKIAEYKTLFRLPYIQLNQQAKTRKCYDTLLLDKTGNLLETTTANIFLLRENKLYIPRKENRLAGIMEKNIIKHGKKLGYTIASRNININQLSSTDKIFITNSLVGALPVKKIDQLNISFMLHN
ncbi:MAG: aminotransferase class IV [Elusimicrobiota bacterium]